jgi:hypothetical protein
MTDKEGGLDSFVQEAGPLFGALISFPNELSYEFSFVAHWRVLVANLNLLFIFT